jgi:EpsI family protein
MQHYLVRVEHYRFGWGVFAVMMVVFFAVGHRMRQVPDSPLPSVQTISNSSRYATLVGLAVALFVVPMIVRLSGVRANAAIASIDIFAPEGWRSADEATASQWQPVFKNADAQVLKHFTKNGLALDAYRAIYATQNQQKKIAGYDNSLVGKSPGRGVIATDKAAGPFMEMELDDAKGNRQLIWYAYHVDGRWFASPMRAQMWSGIKALVARPRTGVIALHADCERDCSQAKRALEEWTSDDKLSKLIDSQ